ncbi:aldo/keto reductase [Streptomyces sp. NPDC020951]|uniref:aldo/keto reductase n=1 Tax=Streptomyces sp. NPDC020951 TaxID=3365104 RepID=UPI0037B4FCA0
MRSIGVSNFEPQDLRNILEHGTVEPAVNQVIAQVGNTSFETFDFCRKHGIVVEAYSPMGHGELLGDTTVVAIFDLPVPSDPGGDLGAGRRAGRLAGDQVGAFDGELAGGEVLSPADDLEGLAGVGVVEVGEGGGLQPSDLQAVVGSGGPTATVFSTRSDPRTTDYVGGRFG